MAARPPEKPPEKPPVIKQPKTKFGPGSKKEKAILTREKAIRKEKIASGKVKNDDWVARREEFRNPEVNKAKGRESAFAMWDKLYGGKDKPQGVIEAEKRAQKKGAQPGAKPVMLSATPKGGAMPKTVKLAEGTAPKSTVKPAEGEKQKPRTPPSPGNGRGG